MLKDSPKGECWCRESALLADEGGGWREQMRHPKARCPPSASPSYGYPDPGGGNLHSHPPGTTTINKALRSKSSWPPDEIARTCTPAPDNVPTLHCFRTRWHGCPTAVPVSTQARSTCRNTPRCICSEFWNPLTPFSSHLDVRRRGS